MIWLLNGSFAFLLLAVCSYLYIDAKNALIKVQMEIPHVKREWMEIVEENKRLSFEIESFESPQHLIELSRKPEFSHLKPVSEGEVLKISGKKGNLQ